MKGPPPEKCLCANYRSRSRVIGAIYVRGGVKEAVPNAVNRLILGPNPVNWLILAPNAANFPSNPFYRLILVPNPVNWLIVAQIPLTT